jgi:CHAD domain-containing protein
MGNLDPILLFKQLDSVFLQVTEYYIAARNDLRPVRLHEFRKKTKDLLYQLWFFRPLKPAIVKSLEKKLTVMTDNLGKYNDLAVMLRELDYRYEPGKNVPALDELAIAVRHEQDRYLSRVWPPAYRIFRPGRQLSDVLRLHPD